MFSYGPLTNLSKPHLKCLLRNRDEGVAASISFTFIRVKKPAS